MYSNYHPACLCEDSTTSVTPVNRVRNLGNRYQVCMTKKTANDIAEGGLVAAFAAPAFFLALPGGAGFLLVMIGWAVKKWGVGNIPAFCCEITPPRPAKPPLMMILPPVFHAIWAQG